MKSHKLVILFAFLFVALFWSCSQKEDSIVNPNSTDLMKGKPTPEKATLDYFQLVVNGTDVYNIGKQALPVIDFTNTSNTYTLKYKISHSDPNFTTQLRLYVHYNPSPIYDYRPWYSGYVVNTMVTAGVEYTQDWNGNVLEGNSLDHTFFTSNWKFMDQKASGGDVSGQIIMDPYNFYIWGDLKYTTNSDFLNMLIKVDEGLGEMFAESITITPRYLNKKQCVPQVKIKLSVNEDGSNNPCVGATILWNWGGNIIGDEYIRGVLTSDENGEIILEGPSYSTTKTGQIIFTLKMVSKTNYVYNPNNNTGCEGIWPVEPHAVLQVP